MWPAALITAGAAAFGRLFVAGILPSTLLVSTIWLVVQADAFSERSAGLAPSDLLPAEFNTDKGGYVLLLLLLVLVLTATLQAFQIAVVRVFEGYWGASPVAVVLFAVGLRRQTRRYSTARSTLVKSDEARRELEAQAPDHVVSQRLPDQGTVLRDAIRSNLRLERARSTLESFPPSRKDFLPTRLGNALRSGERRAGERYGWSTVHTWRRLYSKLPEPLAVSYRSAVDTVDAAAVFCLVFSLIAVFTGAAFWDDPKLYWIPLLGCLFAIASYRGAVTAAVTQGFIQQVAFDLHRFDLLEGLRYKLPSNIEQEQALAGTISTFFADGIDPNKTLSQLKGLEYVHADKSSKAVHRLLQRLSRRARRHSISLDNN